MSLGESILFATVMTLMDEVKKQEQKSSFTVTHTVENDIDINFTFDNLKSKDRLIALADELFDKADKECDTYSEKDTQIWISSLITTIIYESVKSASTDYDTKNRIYDYANKYCNIQTDFSWDALAEDDNNPLEKYLKPLSDMALSMIFISSTVSMGEEITAEFIRLLTELMMHLEEAIKYSFPMVKFEKRFPLVTIDFIRIGMEREMQRLEEADSSLKENDKPFVDIEKIEEFRDLAQDALEIEDTKKAAAYYSLIVNLNPDDWEAVFYKEFCLAFDVPERISTIKMLVDTKHIAQAMTQAMPLAKKQILTRPQLLAELSNVCAWLSNISANYFVTAMNEFKSSLKGSSAQKRKANQIYRIIQMLFICGDAIEENFGSDEELCENLCGACWKLAFECYENCDMPTPSNLYDYYWKLLNYDPSFRCSKNLIGEYKGMGGGEGCYIATAVYGSYDCPQVWILRRYRDFALKQSFTGRLFVCVYYTVSPILIKLFGKEKWFNNSCKKILDKLVTRLRADGYNDNPYND